MKRFPLALLALLLVVASPATARAACDTTVLPDGTRVAELVTALGSICFQLLDAEAPAHTENFLYYVENGLVADSFFHRSVANFIVQGGSFRIGQDQLPEPVPTRGVVVMTCHALAMRLAGVPKAEVLAFYTEATSGDYDHLLQTCIRWVDCE